MCVAQAGLLQNLFKRLKAERRMQGGLRTETSLQQLAELCSNP